MFSCLEILLDSWHKFFLQLNPPHQVVPLIDCVPTLLISLVALPTVIHDALKVQLKKAAVERGRQFFLFTTTALQISSPILKSITIYIIILSEQVLL